MTAVTQVIAAVTGTDISQSQLFLMAKRRMACTLPRAVKYHDTYDIDDVWAAIDAWPPNDRLDMERLREKVIIFLKLDTMGRNSDVARLFREDLSLKLTDRELLLRFYGAKERPHAFTDWISIAACTDRSNLCTVAAVREYLRRTQHRNISPQSIRVGRNTLSMRPLILQLGRAAGVSEDLISNSTKKVLRESGIPNEFDAHSTRSATISKAVQLGVNQDRVRLHARISSADIFRKHYLRIRTGRPIPVQNPNEMHISDVLRYTYLHRP